MPSVDPTTGCSINGRKSVVKLLSNKLNKQYNYYLLLNGYRDRTMDNK